MSLREKQKEMTRELIIDALAEVVVEQGIRGFSIDDVAERAGVSVRTLYRYYAGYDELLAGLLERMADALGSNDTVPTPANIDEAFATIRPRVATFGEHDMLARAAVAIVAATEVGDASDHELLAGYAAARRERNEGLRQMLRDSLPDLPEPMLDQLFAMIRLMVSVVGWAHATGPTGGLDSDSAAVGCHWAVKTLVDRARELEASGAQSFEEDL